MGRIATYLAALTVVGVFLTISAIVWFPPPPPVSAAEQSETTRKHVEHNLMPILDHGGAKVSALARFVHVECRCGRDMEDWAMVQVPPAIVAQIRRAVVTDANRGSYTVRTATFIKSDGELLGPHADHRPSWSPMSLAGAEVVAVGELEGSVYVFSGKTGTIYVMSWTV